MLVYRVEHKDTCIGPYHSRFNVNIPIESHQQLFNILTNFFFKRHHVDPSDDMIDGTSFNLYGWKFGFKDEKSLTKWFNNHRGIKGLQNLGFVVRVYEVPSDQVKQMKSQIAYCPSVAKLSSEHALYSFCKKHSEFFA